MLDQTSNDELRLARLEAQLRELTTKVSRAKRPQRRPRVVFDVKSVMEPIKWLSAAVTVDDAGGTSVAWTTFDASEYVPFETTDVILDVYAENAPGGGELRFQARRSSSDVELEFSGCTAASDTCAGQIICPVVRSYEKRTFDYKITSPGAGPTWAIRLIGYIKANKVYGASVTDARPGAGGTTGTGGTPSSGGSIIPPIS